LRPLQIGVRPVLGRCAVERAALPAGLCGCAAVRLPAERRLFGLAFAPPARFDG
jgi:hypothetical protein